MIRIIDDRGTGKTRKLLEAAKEQNAIVVCGNPSAMRGKAHSYGIIGLDFISYGQFLRSEEGLSNEIKYMVDELENLLSFRICGYTLTVED